MTAPSTAQVSRQPRPGETVDDTVGLPGALYEADAAPATTVAGNGTAPGHDEHREDLPAPAADLPSTVSPERIGLGALIRAGGSLRVLRARGAQELGHESPQAAARATEWALSYPLVFRTELARLGATAIGRDVAGQMRRLSRDVRARAHGYTRLDSVKDAVAIVREAIPIAGPGLANAAVRPIARFVRWRRDQNQGVADDNYQDLDEMHEHVSNGGRGKSRRYPEHIREAWYGHRGDYMAGIAGQYDRYVQHYDRTMGDRSRRMAGRADAIRGRRQDIAQRVTDHADASDEAKLTRARIRAIAAQAHQSASRDRTSRLLDRP